MDCNQTGNSENESTLYNVEKFDAAGYTKAALDAIYRGEFEAYSGYRNTTESNVEKEIKDLYEAVLESSLAGLRVSETGKAEYRKAVDEAYRLAAYEVKGAEEQEEGGFKVAIEVTPANVFALATRYMKEAAGSYTEEQLMAEDGIVQLMTEQTRRAAADNTYGKREVIEAVLSCHKALNEYEFAEDEWMKMEAALFTVE